LGSTVRSQRRSALVTVLALASGITVARGQTRLRITVIGERDELRALATNEAVEFWNGQLEEARARIRLGPIHVIDETLPDQILSDLSEDVLRQRSLWRVPGLIEPFPGQIVVAMSRADIMSFAVPWRPGSKGFIALRRADVAPLSFPNVARNAVAHELGHVLGLPHNSDPNTLMCGRPAPCRPEAFGSDTPRIFPLTSSEKQRLRELWPEARAQTTSRVPH
jgi:hypothetical protein